MYVAQSCWYKPDLQLICTHVTTTKHNEAGGEEQDSTCIYGLLWDEWVFDK